MHLDLPRGMGTPPPTQFYLAPPMPSPLPDRPPPRAYLQLLLGLVLAFQGLALAIGGA